MIDFLEGLFASTFWSAVIKVMAAFILLLVTVMLLVWLERRLIAAMQNRIGPNRAGPFGLLQTVADGVKLFFKESIRPRRAEFGLYLLAPIAAAIPAFLIFLVIPIGRPFTIGQTRVTMQVADLNVAILFVLAMSSIAVYSIVLSGWASGSKYPLLGGVRATAQMISYETAMALSLVPVVLFASAQIAGGSVGLGTMSMSTIVELQSGSFRGPIPGWFVFWLLPSFIVFFIAGVAETNRPPFDMVEAESELVGGYHTEYSGVRFALFFLAEYISMFNIAALTVTLFLGGWLGPDFGLPPWIAWAMPTFWFLLKTYALVCVFVWIRASLPRMRYDRLMTFGWKRLIPFSLAWLVLFALLQAVRRFGAPWG
ncbi:MAG TPA: NADH-quinone oxidoreductase subunit NuoH [Acidimicrobiia bacterium]|nr:NADH-quinone oxidoreductase subunit NuoH [Acidimicrobiia bacterium]